MAIDMLGACVGIGGSWYIVLGVVSCIAAWKATIGFTVELETNEPLLSSFITKERASAYQQLFRATWWLGILYQVFQIITLAMDPIVGWHSTASSWQYLRYLNFIGEGDGLLIAFWIVFGVQMLFTVFYMVFGAYPLIAAWRQSYIEMKAEIKLRENQQVSGNSAHFVELPHEPQESKEELQQGDGLMNRMSEHLLKVKLFGGLILYDIVLLPSLLLFFELINCEYPANAPSYLRSNVALKCWQGEHVVYSVFSVIGLLTLSLCALLFAVDRNTDSWYMHYPRFNLLEVITKLFLGSIATVWKNEWAFSAVLLLCTLLLFAVNFIYQPCLNKKIGINYWRSCCYAAATWSALCSLLSIPLDSNDLMEILLWALLVPVLLIGGITLKITSSFIHKRRLSALAAASKDTSTKALRSLAHYILRLSVNDLYRKELSTPPRMKHFVVVLAAHDDVSVRMPSLRALGNLVLNTDFCNYIAFEKMLLVYAVGVQSTRDIEKRNIARTIANIAVNEPNRRMLLKANLLNLCLSYLSCHTCEVRLQALRALRNMLYLEEAKFQLIADGGIPKLLPLTVSKIKALKTYVDEILLTLSCNPRCREAMQEIGVLKPLLSHFSKGAPNAPPEPLSVMNTIATLATVDNCKIALCSIVLSSNIAKHTISSAAFGALVNEIDTPTNQTTTTDTQVNNTQNHSSTSPKKREITASNSAPNLHPAQETEPTSVQVNNLVTGSPPATISKGASTKKSRLPPLDAKAIASMSYLNELKSSRKFGTVKVAPTHSQHPPVPKLYKAGTELRLNINRFT